MSSIEAVYHCPRAHSVYGFALGVEEINSVRMREHAADFDSLSERSVFHARRSDPRIKRDFRYVACEIEIEIEEFFALFEERAVFHRGERYAAEIVLRKVKIAVRAL